jgi:hypothetical protein
MTLRSTTLGIRQESSSLGKEHGGPVNLVTLYSWYRLGIDSIEKTTHHFHFAIANPYFLSEVPLAPFAHLQLHITISSVCVTTSGDA